MNPGMELYVNGLFPLVTTLGPGRRIGLWLQGCSFRCPGCMTPELFERDESFCRQVPAVFLQMVDYNYIVLEELLQRIKSDSN